MERDCRTDRVPGKPEYDPPQVERVIGPEEIAREVQYAGGFPPPPSDTP